MAEPFRVLAVSHAYPRRSATSHGIFIHRWNAGLQRHGVDVRVLQLAEWTPPWPLSEVDAAWRRGRRAYRDMVAEFEGVPVYHPRTFIPRPSRFFSGDAWDREANTLIDYCRRQPELRAADIVVGHFMLPDGYHALRLGRALGIPVAAVAWGDDVHAWPAERPYWRDRLRDVLTGVDLPIACSQRLVDDGNSWLDAPRDDWQVVYGGVDVERFFPSDDRASARARVSIPLLHRLPPSEMVMLMVGQRVRAKGYVDLLDAWERLGAAGERWHLVMVGADWGDVDIVSEIAIRGLTEQVHWIGPCPAEDMPALLRAVDAFVLPSHNEGLSLTMLEAMASALPTIATNVGGHAEVITSSEEGWLIPARDVTALESALRELMTDASERLRRGRGARRAAERVGSPAENARRLSAVLTTTVNGSARGRRAVAV